MAIVISGVNNNDKITASDGTIDLLSGVNFNSELTVPSFKVGNNIQIGNAGIITATTYIGNLTGNVNATSNLLLQIGGSEKFRVGGSGQLGIGGANYGTSGQVLTSGGSGSAATWSTVTGTTINNNANDRIITGSNTANTLNANGNLTYSNQKVSILGSQKELLGLQSTHAEGPQFSLSDASGAFAYLGSAKSLFSVGSVTDLGLRTANNIVFGINGNEKVRIDSSGRLLHKHTASRNVGTKTGQIQVINSGNDATISIIQNNNAASAPFLAFGKTRSGDATGSTIVQSQDSLGQILFAGADGTDVDSIGAWILAQVDGTPGANDMPGRLIFSTTADGSSTPTERLRINSYGLVTAPFQYHLHADRTGNQTGYNAGGDFGTPMIFNQIVSETKDSTLSSCFNTSNGLFTAPVTGLYLFNASVYSSGGGNIFSQSWFTLNGGRCSGTDWVINSGYNFVQNTQVIRLAAGNTVGFKPYAGGQSNVTLSANNNHTYFKVTLIG